MTVDDAFAFIVGVEGGLSKDPQDPGNWTGGKVNVGTLKGTKYGVSAASYPLLDIANLTLADAKSIFQRDWWLKLGAASLPTAVALPLVDFAYNAGIQQSVRTAQHALGLTPDGVLGPNTMAALQANVPGFGIAFTAWRVIAYTQMGGWPHDGVGWTVRALQCYERSLQ